MVPGEATDGPTADDVREVSLGESRVPPAAAFSPTDVMPLTLRAKYIMILQSTVSLALFGLIVARAVNAFT